MIITLRVTDLNPYVVAPIRADPGPVSARVLAVFRITVMDLGPARTTESKARHV